MPLEVTRQQSVLDEPSRRRGLCDVRLAALRQCIDRDGDDRVGSGYSNMPSASIAAAS